MSLDIWIGLSVLFAVMIVVLCVCSAVGLAGIVSKKRKQELAKLEERYVKHKI